MVALGSAIVLGNLSQKRNQIRKKFAEAMKTFEYCLLFRPAANSPLGWRECLVFSAIVHLARKKARVSVRAIDALTGLDREAIPKALAKLKEIGVLDDDLAVLNCEQPSRHFAVVSTPSEGDHWLKSLAYGRYLRPADTKTWKPLQSYFLAVLVAVAPVVTSVSYLATITGIDRKQIRDLLRGFEELGLEAKREDKRLVLDYGKFSPDGNCFIEKTIAAKKAPQYPQVLTSLVEAGKIPSSYLDDLTHTYNQVSRCVYDPDIKNVVNECVEIHKTFVPKNGSKKPYPSLKFIVRKLVGIFEKRSSITVAA